MKHTSKYILLIWLKIVLTNATNVATIPNEFIELGLTECPFISYCIAGGVQYNGSVSTCCMPCICNSECSNLNFTIKCSPGYYKRSKFRPTTPGWKQTVRKSFNYLMVTSCRDGSDCDVLTPDDDNVTLYDFEPVYSAKYNLLFQDRRCAQCNGIEETFAWEMKALACGSTYPKQLYDSEKKLQEHLIRHCVLVALPPDGTQYKHFKCEIAPGVVITRCNMSGFWDVYDEHIQHACEAPIGWSPTTDGFVTFKNIYCYLCNYNPNTWEDQLGCAGYTNENALAKFHQIFSLTSDSRSKSNRLVDKCAEGEVFDWYYRKCRELHCPPLTKAAFGSCEKYSDNFSDVHYEVYIILLPISPYKMDGDANFPNHNPSGQVQKIVKAIDGAEYVGYNMQVFIDKSTRLTEFVSARLYFQAPNSTYEQWQKFLQRLYIDDDVIIVGPYSFIMKPYAKPGVINAVYSHKSLSSSRTFSWNNYEEKQNVYLEIQTDKLYPYIIMSQAEYCELSSTVFIKSTTFGKDSSCPLLYDTILHNLTWRNDIGNCTECIQYFVELGVFEQLVNSLAPSYSGISAYGSVSLLSSCFSITCILYLLLP